MWVEALKFIVLGNHRTKYSFFFLRLLSGVVLFFSQTSHAQFSEWYSKTYPKRIAEYHYQNGKLKEDPRSNLIKHYSKKGTLQLLLKYDKDSTLVDSTAYFSSGRIKKKKQKGFDGDRLEEYYENGQLKKVELINSQTGKLLSFKEYTVNGQLINEDYKKRYVYSDENKLLSSEVNHGYYKILKHYNYSAKGLVKDVDLYQIKNNPQEVVFLNNANKNDVLSEDNPFLNEIEKKQDFDIQVTNIDRAELGILDQRQATDISSLIMLQNNPELVYTKEEFFLQPNGTITKEDRRYTNRNEDGLLIKSLIVKDSVWSFSGYEYEFSSKRELNKQIKTTSKMKGTKTIYQYVGNVLKRIVEVNPDSSVVSVENVTIVDGGVEIVRNHYEPYQALKYTIVEFYQEGNKIKEVLYDSHGKEINSLPEEKKKLKKIHYLGEQANLTSQDSLLKTTYLKEVIDYSKKDSISRVSYVNGERVLSQIKTYDEFGQLVQDATLYKDGKVEGVRFDTIMQNGRLIKRSRKENGVEVFCQKFVYDGGGNLYGVYVYPDGEKKFNGRELYFYDKNNDTTQVLSISGNDTVQINYSIKRDRKKRLLENIKTLKVKSLIDTLSVEKNKYFSKEGRNQIILKGQPVFSAQVDTIYRNWSSKGILTSELFVSQEGKVLKEDTYYETGQQKKKVDKYGYETYYFEDGVLKGHGRDGRLTELFDKEGKVLHQKRRHNDLEFFKYQYRNRELDGHDIYVFIDSIEIVSEEILIDSSFKHLSDPNSDNYIITYLGNNEYLYENRKDLTKYIFKSEEETYPRAFALFRFEEAIRFEFIDDSEGNWIRKVIYKNGEEVSEIRREIEYWR